MKTLLPGLLFIGVLGALARLLSESSGTRRILRLCTVLFLAASVCTGVLRQPDFRTEHAALPADYAAEAVLQTARQAIEQTARQVLDAQGLTQAQIRVEMTVRDGEAHTESFLLCGVPPQSAREIEDEIFARTGERPVTVPAAAAPPG